jgi:hypothetical protein
MNDYKRIPYRNKKILQAAKEQECTMNTPECNHNSATVVACHSNSHQHGKGAGQKADDIYVAFGCSACHHYYDETPGVPSDIKQMYWNRGFQKTIRLLLDLKVLK